LVGKTKNVENGNEWRKMQIIGVGEMGRSRKREEGRKIEGERD